jgi:hypothetical protein
VRRERSGFLYVDVAGFLRQALAAAGGDSAQFAPLVDPVAQALPKTIAAALDAEPDLLRIESAAFGNRGGVRPAASGADALAALPADAWLGVGVGEVGRTVNGVLDRVSAGGGLAGVGVQALLGQAQQSLGLDIRRDVLGWMGDAGVYVAGTSKAGVRAAVVIGSKDPAATRRTVAALETLARRGGGDVVPLRAAGVDAGFAVRRGGSDHELLVAAGGDRFVVALGRRALSEALDPGAGLGSTRAFQDAASKLQSGVRPSFFVDVSRFGRLLDSKPGAGGRGRELREYLGAFGAVVGGSRRDGDVTRGEAVATLP